MKIIKLIFFTLCFFVLATTAMAHPGGTDAYGCHTCRTNCSKWGLGFGEYHCHNAKGYEQPIAPIKSTYGEYGGYTAPAPEYGYQRSIQQEAVEVVKESPPAPAVSLPSASVEEVEAKEPEASYDSQEDSGFGVFVSFLIGGGIVWAVMKGRE